MSINSVISNGVVYYEKKELNGYQIIESWDYENYFHKDDGYCKKINNGDKEWRQYGVLHRENGPAFDYDIIDNKIIPGRRKEWYLNGKLHRLDGPAVEYYNGIKEWWIYNKRHRTDGPAIEYSDGSYAYYQHNLLHREDGPASMMKENICEYYICGIPVTPEEYLTLMKLDKL